MFNLPVTDLKLFLFKKGKKKTHITSGNAPLGHHHIRAITAAAFFFRSVGFRHLFSILRSSLISLHTLQALWLNYVLRSMSKHGRRVICREFPFIHYYSEG